MYTFAISNRNRNEIDDILKDKYHNYLTRCEENDNLIYIESFDKIHTLKNIFIMVLP